MHLKPLTAAALLLAAAFGLSGCIAATAAGAVVGVTGAAVGTAAKGAGMAVGAVMPHHDSHDR